MQWFGHWSHSKLNAWEHYKVDDLPRKLMLHSGHFHWQSKLEWLERENEKVGDSLSLSGLNHLSPSRFCRSIFSILFLFCFDECMISCHDEIKMDLFIAHISLLYVGDSVVMFLLMLNKWIWLQLMTIIGKDDSFLSLLLFQAIFERLLVSLRNLLECHPLVWHSVSTFKSVCGKAQIQ